MTKASPITLLIGLGALWGILVVMILVAPWMEPVQDAIRLHILVKLQLPVLLTATLVGAALAVSGACLQIVLRNPLADPGVIGISSGASLVAAFLLILAPSALLPYLHYWLPLSCFAGALLSTWLIYRISRHLQGLSAAVILAGIAITTIAGAILGWLYLFADAQSLRNLTFWIMGSLYQADWLILAVAAPLIIISVVYLLLQASRLNRYYAGDMIAASAGVNPVLLSRFVLLACAVSVGAAVSIAGSIAFIGLLVPHFLRLVLGYNNKVLLPACALTGAIILLFVVLLTESLQMISIPVSMVTATVGGPLLLFAMYRGQLR